MKKWILALLFIALIACAPVQEEKDEVQETTEVVQEQTTEPVVEETIEEVQTPETTVEEKVETPAQEKTEPKNETVQKTQTVQATPTDPKLKDLMRRVDEKIKSIEYLYGGSETGNLFLDTYYIKGDKMKIKKYSEDYYVREDHYDNIYVNLGIACCEERSRCLSKNVDNTNRKFELDVEKLVIPKTPMQWAKEIPATAKIVGPQTMDERSVTYITYIKDGVTYDMWLDDTYGIPHKVIIETEQGEIVYKFNDLKFNLLEEADFRAPCQ